MKKNLLRNQFGLWVVLILLFTASCHNDPIAPPSSSTANVALDADVAEQWFKLYLQVERYTQGYTPPVSARTLAYLGMIGYEAVNPGYSKRFGSIADEYRDLRIPGYLPTQRYNWEIVLNSAFETAFGYYFETAPTAQQASIRRLANEIHNDVNEIDANVSYRSRSYGKRVAEVITEWSARDRAGHRGYLRNTDPSYIPPGGKGKWSPTYPDYLQALLPHWGDVRTFVADKSDKVQDPIPYSENRRSELYNQALETKRLVDGIKNGRFNEDHWIADFWSDDCSLVTFTPAGRWIAITNQLVGKDKMNLDKALYMYAKVGMALSDAGVRAWGEKYRYNYIRPVDYIQSVMRDRSWNTLMCPAGSGRYHTPNFPAYPSGHAAFASAAAEVLTETMGINHRMTDNSHKGRTEFHSDPRTFNSFRDMAQECGYSRLPIGVHFRMDSEAGISLGRRIGAKINNNLSWMK